MDRELAPLVSVVIPTHNRGNLLLRTLEALADQTYPADSFEVLVVADGCTDPTARLVQELKTPYALQLIEQSGAGAATARNRGAEQARGELLIFLDDDIEVQPGFIQAHVDAHQGQPDQVVIGYLPTRLGISPGYFHAELTGWWDQMFQKMSEPGHRFAYSDLLSGNFSIPASLFNEVGKFNPNFRVHEDYELGLRLVKCKARFHFSPSAWGWHYENTDLPRALERKVAEGSADIELCRLYPELVQSTLMFSLHQYSRLPSRIMQLFAFRWPAAGDRLANLLLQRLDILEKGRAYGSWQRVLYGLMGYWYWRGIGQKFISRTAHKLYLKSSLNAPEPPRAVLDVDLAQGLEAVEQLVDTARPDNVTVRYGQTPIGMIPYQIGCERLHAGHLRPALANHLSIPLVRAYALNGVLELPGPLEPLVAWCDLKMKEKGKLAD